MLLALGLGSQIGILEGMLCVIFDIDLFKRVKKQYITGKIFRQITFTQLPSRELQIDTWWTKIIVRRCRVHRVLHCWSHILHRSRGILADAVRQFSQYYRPRCRRAHGDDIGHLHIRPRKVSEIPISKSYRFKIRGRNFFSVF